MLYQLAHGGESYTDRGESADANLLGRRLEEARRHFPERSVTLGETHRLALAALRETYEEAADNNWDGYGAMAVSPLVYYRAQRFLQILPPGFPVPEVGVDPDGEISLEWYRGPRKVFSVSLAGNGRLSYAGIFGLRSTHGTDFLGDELPDAVVANLTRLFS